MWLTQCFHSFVTLLLSHSAGRDAQMGPACLASSPWHCIPPSQSRLCHGSSSTHCLQTAGTGLASLQGFCCHQKLCASSWSQVSSRRTHLRCSSCVINCSSRGVDLGYGSCGISCSSSCAFRRCHWSRAWSAGHGPTSGCS